MTGKHHKDYINNNIFKVVFYPKMTMLILLQIKIQISLLIVPSIKLL